MFNFEPVKKYEKGIVFSLLSQSWEELWNNELEEIIKQFDKDIFESHSTVGACAFITSAYMLEVI